MIAQDKNDEFINESSIWYDDYVKANKKTFQIGDKIEIASFVTGGNSSIFTYKNDKHIINKIFTVKSISIKDNLHVVEIENPEGEIYTMKWAIGPNDKFMWWGYLYLGFEKLNMIAAYKIKIFN